MDLRCKIITIKKRTSNLRRSLEGSGTKAIREGKGLTLDQEW